MVEENLRKLLPQYLGEMSKAANDSSITNQPTTPRRLLGRPSNPPPLAQSDDGPSLKEGIVDHPQFSGDFTFKIPRFQENEDNHADKPLPLFTPEAAVETQRFDPRVSFPLQTPTRKLSRRSSSFMPHGETTNSLHQPTVSQQSSMHHEPPERLLFQGNQVSSQVYPLSTTFEGSSPTLHVAASRSRRHSSVNSQREFYAQGGSPNNILSEASNDNSLRPGAGFGGNNRAGVTDPVVAGETVPPLQPSRPIRRNKSLQDVQRRRDGESLLLIRGKLRL